jgi:hypothetical protein
MDDIVTETQDRSSLSPSLLILLSSSAAANHDRSRAPLPLDCRRCGLAPMAAKIGEGSSALFSLDFCRRSRRRRDLAANRLDRLVPEIALPARR